MKIALVQAPLVWENIEKNKQYFLEQLNALESKVDLVVLPEMFLSGFTMSPKGASISMQDKFIVDLQSICKRLNLALTGSLVIEENQVYYNRLLFILPTGEIETYNKRHLFSLAGEEKVYQAGEERLLVKYKDWTICPLVCYDLRFPVFSRNYGEAYDLLIYVASWPDQRIYAWDTLMKARAIENMSYTIAVNRYGVDENSNIYSGHSQAIDFMGQYIQEPIDGEQIVYVAIDKATQDKARSRFGFLGDADQFNIVR